MYYSNNQWFECIYLNKLAVITWRLTLFCCNWSFWSRSQKISLSFSLFSLWVVEVLMSSELFFYSISVKGMSFRSWLLCTKLFESSYRMAKKGFSEDSLLLTCFTANLVWISRQFEFSLLVFLDCGFSKISCYLLVIASKICFSSFFSFWLVNWFFLVSSLRRKRSSRILIRSYWIIEVMDYSW